MAYENNELVQIISEAEMAFLHHSPTSYLPSGYTFRGAKLNDAPAVVYLLNQRQLQRAAFRVEDFRREWQTPRFNPAMDVRMVFDQREMLVGYIEAWVTDDEPVLWGCVHPDYEGRGVGSALLRWGEARVRLALESLPMSLWAAPRFSALPLQRAHELCEHLGWRQVRPQMAEIKKVTGALHLPETAILQYDVYEKEIDQLN
jgi:ribosomal protein S18 acetylase RimI-like enzyme